MKVLAELKLTKKPKDYGKVAVLLGGSSAEREISLRSGEAIYQSLIEANIDAVKIDPIEGLYQKLIDSKVDRAFIALHGRDGEDGVVQGFLKTLEIPFTGSNVSSSAIAMNKVVCKKIWQHAGVPTANFVEVNRAQNNDLIRAQAIVEQLDLPLFIKPIHEGSSVGMSKAESVEQLVDSINLALQYDNNVLVESFIDGDEYTVTILKGFALPSISMRTPNQFYDYHAKYESKQTQYFCPSGLDESEEKLLGDIASRAFELIGCTGWGRVDFIREGEKGEFLILEANTVPGMTQTSLVPKSARAAGIEFQQLVLHILDTSFSHQEGNNHG